MIALTCENQTSVQSRKERVSFHPYLFSQTLYLHSIFYVTFELHILCSDDESSIYLLCSIILLPRMLKETITHLMLSNIRTTPKESRWCRSKTHFFAAEHNPVKSTSPDCNE